MGKEEELEFNPNEEIVNLKDESPNTKDASGPGELSLQKKYITTVVIYFCNITFGMAALYLAPITVVFVAAMQTNMTSVSAIFTATRVLMLACSLAFGFIFNILNRHLLVVISLFTTGALLIVMPFGPTLPVFAIINVILSIVISCYAMAQIVWVIEIWKDAAGPYIQAQHFFFALGTIFPGLIFAPFLKSTNTRNESFSVSNMTISPLQQLITSSAYPDLLQSPGLFASQKSVATTESTVLNALSLPVVSLENLYIPSGIIGGIVLLGAIFQLLLFIFIKPPKAAEETPKNRRLSSQGKITDSKLNLQKAQRMKKIVIILLASLVVGMFQAMEANAFGFLPTFAYYSAVKMTEEEGAYMMTCFALAYTLARLAGIFLSLKIPPQYLLCMNVIFVVAANGVLLAAGNRTDTKTMMLVGSTLLGIAFSTSVPSIFDYMKIHLEITNVIGAIIMVAGGSIAALFPIIVGVFIETVPAVIVYLNFVSVTIALGTFFGIIVLTRGSSGKL